MFNESNLSDLIGLEQMSMLSSNGIETYSTVDVSEVERLKAQGWVVESTRVVLIDLVCYDMVRLA